MSKQASNVWQCLNCEGHPTLNAPEMMTHIKEVHGFDPKTTKGTKSMQMHVDGADWFSYTWDWEIQGLKFLQHTTQPRNPSWR